MREAGAYGGQVCKVELPGKRTFESSILKLEQSNGYMGKQWKHIRAALRLRWRQQTISIRRVGGSGTANDPIILHMARVPSASDGAADADAAKEEANAAAVVAAAAAAAAATADTASCHDDGHDRQRQQQKQKKGRLQREQQVRPDGSQPQQQRQKQQRHQHQQQRKHQQHPRPEPTLSRGVFAAELGASIAAQALSPQAPTPHSLSTTSGNLHSILSPTAQGHRQRLGDAAATGGTAAADVTDASDANVATARNSYAAAAAA